jgi:hypothetical protein
MTRSWLHRIVGRTSRPAPARPRPGKRLRPCFEALEDRLVPTFVPVTTNLDSGPGSLRDAITQVNASADQFNDISLSSGLASPIKLSTALPALVKNVFIEGPGAGALTVERDPAAATGFGIFTVNAGAQVSLVGLTISGGLAVNGGGIDNHGQVTLEDSELTGNSATGSGGGIFSDAAVPAPGRTTPSGVTIINSAVVNNSTSGAGSAGGIDVESSSLFVQNSTLSGNESTNGSNVGGILFKGSFATISNSTIANNVATGAGEAGGLDVPAAGAGQGPTALLTDTIVAHNFSNSTSPDVLGSITSAAPSGTAPGGHNLIGDGTGAAGLVNGQNGDQVGTSGNVIDPKLGTLQNNGGPTDTMDLMAGSPAIDAGSNPVTPPGSPVPVLPADQRGRVRVVNNVIDIGAVEANSGQVADRLDVFPTPEASGGTPGQFTVPANTALTLNVSVSPVVIGASPNAAAGTVHVTVDTVTLLPDATLGPAGSASRDLGRLSPGPHTVVVSYASTNSFAPGSSTLTLQASTNSPAASPPRRA